jgi:rSAM/selenodomain-associated transferase 2
MTASGSGSRSMALSIIMPVLDEAANISEALRRLAPLHAQGAEIIVVDGGSSDGTAALAQPLADKVLGAQRGRALQMNAGAAAATCDVLLFLHADTQAPEDAGRTILDRLAASDRAWGRFDVRFEGGGLLRMIGFLMNARSRLTGIATGDQAMFVARAAFESVGGFPDIPLMEDVAISVRLKRVSRPLCLRATVTTSGRRWERQGVLRTILLMWKLRFAYFFGADPRRLARQYGYSIDPIEYSKFPDNSIASEANREHMTFL